MFWQDSNEGGRKWKNTSYESYQRRVRKLIPYIY